MFLRRIPYQSVRRRRIRHWLLLVMRLAALALIVLAFARPFFRGADAAGGGGGRRARSGRSCSIARTAWATAIAGAQALAAAQSAIDGLTPADRASIVFFGSGTEVALRSTVRSRPAAAALAGVQPGAGRDALRSGAEAGRQHPRRVGAAAARGDPDHRLPAQRLARRDGVRLPDGAVLTPVADRRCGHQQPRGDAGGAPALDVLRPGAGHRHGRRDESRREGRWTRVEVTLEVDGRAIQTQRVNVDGERVALDHVRAGHADRVATCAPRCGWPTMR